MQISEVYEDDEGPVWLLHRRRIIVLSFTSPLKVDY